MSRVTMKKPMVLRIEGQPSNCHTHADDIVVLYRAAGRGVVADRHGDCTSSSSRRRRLYLAVGFISRAEKSATHRTAATHRQNDRAKRRY